MIHIMYGREGEYGICSHLATTKAGINAYLEGYLKDGNMRFRDGPIKFIEKSPVELDEGHILTKWDNKKKKLENLSFDKCQY